MSHDITNRQQRAKATVPSHRIEPKPRPAPKQQLHHERNQSQSEVPVTSVREERPDVQASDQDANSAGIVVSSAPGRSALA